MKYGPGEQAVPELHSSGFNLLSALGCGRVGIPFLDIRGVGRSGAEQHKGQAYLFGGVCRCVCVFVSQLGACNIQTRTY